MKRHAHLFAIPDVAEQLGVSVTHVERLIEKGLLRVVPASSEPSIHAADLDALRQSVFEAAAAVETESIDRLEVAVV